LQILNDAHEKIKPLLELSIKFQDFGLISETALADLEFFRPGSQPNPEFLRRRFKVPLPNF
jgi:hypothetical protein